MERYERLRQLILERAVRRGQVVLASGRKSDYYIDAKMVTLDPEGVSLIAQEILEVLNGEGVEAIGGPTLGADPIVAAVATLSYQRDKPIVAFIVRKETKSHGTTKMIEGPIPTRKGAPVAIVEDVTTTGASLLKAIEVAEAAGLRIALAISLVDREEGAQETLAAHGYRLRSLFTKSALGL